MRYLKSLFLPGVILYTSIFNYSFAENFQVKAVKQEKTFLKDPSLVIPIDDESLIDVTIGNGAGINEEIMYRTMTYLPNIDSVYTVYLGFFGVRFANFNREVRQSRYTSQGFFRDGELAVLPEDSMAFETIFNNFTIETGYMHTVMPVTSDTIRIRQKKYIREDFEDSFFILEYTVYNETDTTMWNGRVIFFTDFDVGDSYSDNLTGIAGTIDDSSFIYQYSPDDDYAGFALIYPDSASQFGNYYNWVASGTDTKIDSMVAHSFPSDSDSVYVLYDTLFENYPGDLSVYIVNEIGDLLPGQQRTITYAFAIGETYEELADQLFLAKDRYLEYLPPLKSTPIPDSPVYTFHLTPPYPNPFNSSTAFELVIDNSQFGEIVVYDILGRRVDTIFKGFFASGTHKFKWNADGSVASGLYYISAELSGIKSTNQVIYIK